MVGRLWLLALPLVMAWSANDDLPRRVESALGPVPVLRPATLYSQGVPLWGEVDYDQRIIRVLAGLSPTVARHTLAHERCHLALHDLNVTLPDSADEEAVCDAWATARLKGW